MLRPIRRQVKGRGKYKQWDVDTKLKCPLITVRYETGPRGRKIRQGAFARNER